MSTNKKYFYLKFKENYFDQDHIKVIESMQNGHIYSLILLKLYLKSLKYDGQLMINEAIPYNAQKVDLLAGVINHDPDHVSKAINIAKDLGVMEIMSTGEMFMADIQNFIGHDSSEAERKRLYRERLANKCAKQLNDNIGTMSQKRPPEIELNIEKELELDIEKEKETSFSLHIKQIIDYLNVQCNKQYTYKNKSYNRTITARLKNGYTVDQMKKVIDNKKDDKWFIENGHLNPDTLFREKNIDKYLNIENKKTMSYDYETEQSF